MTILLQQVIDAIEMAGDAYTRFYDKKTGESVSLPDSFQIDDVDEELEEFLETEPDRFLRFPEEYDIHKYSIMERFIESIPDASIRNDLAQAIRGRGAFRRFKSSIRYYGIEQLWYDYLENAYREIAIRWCREHDLKYACRRTSQEVRGLKSFSTVYRLELTTSHLARGAWIEIHGASRETALT